MKLTSYQLLYILFELSFRHRHQSPLLLENPGEHQSFVARRFWPFAALDHEECLFWTNIKTGSAAKTNAVVYHYGMFVFKRCDAIRIAGLDTFSAECAGIFVDSNQKRCFRNTVREAGLDSGH